MGMLGLGVLATLFGVYGVAVGLLILIGWFGARSYRRTGEQRREDQ